MYIVICDSFSMLKVNNKKVNYLCYGFHSKYSYAIYFFTKPTRLYNATIMLHFHHHLLQIYSLSIPHRHRHRHEHLFLIVVILRHSLDHQFLRG